MNIFLIITLILIAIVIVIALVIYSRLSALVKSDGQTFQRNEMIHDELTKKLEETRRHEQDVRHDLMKEIEELRNKLDKTLNEHSSSQKLHFSEIEKKNLEEMMKIKDFLNIKMSDNLLQLVDTNKKSFLELSETNHNKLEEIRGHVTIKMDEQLKKNLESFHEVQKNLILMQESAGKMIDSSKSVDRLNQLFARGASKSFGDFGEKMLEQFLQDNLPDHTWTKQYVVPGTAYKIDYCLSLGGYRIGIDSKFPATKYGDYIDAEQTEREKVKKELFREIKGMAKDLAEKYMSSNHFAYIIMYIPSDGLYTELQNDQEIVSSFATLKVTLASPNSIMPMILALSDYDLRIKVNQNAEKIISGLKKIAKNVDAFQNEFRKLGDKLRQAQTNYDEADKNLVGLKREVLTLENREEEVLMMDTETHLPVIAK
jgi:DNA recombination protein RmuC